MNASTCGRSLAVGTDADGVCRALIRWLQAWAMPATVTGPRKQLAVRAAPGAPALQQIHLHQVYGI